MGPAVAGPTVAGPAVAGSGGAMAGGVRVWGRRRGPGRGSFCESCGVAGGGARAGAGRPRGPGAVQARAADRLESAKAGAVAAVAGSLAALPAGLLLPGALSAQWEFDTDMQALSLALFGLVYRYAARPTGDPASDKMLGQGAVGAFALTRAMAGVRVGPQCSAVPLVCGPPLGYFDWDMLGQAAVRGTTAALAFGGAALALEAAMERGLVGRARGVGDPGGDKGGRGEKG